MRQDTAPNSTPDERPEDENPAGEIRLTPRQIGLRVTALAGVVAGGFIAMSPATISSMK